jgi:hypothetical protein
MISCDPRYRSSGDETLPPEVAGGGHMTKAGVQVAGDFEGVKADIDVRGPDWVLGLFAAGE